MKKALFTLGLLAIVMPAFADLVDELNNLVGYTIIDSKIVAGHIDKNEKKEDDFEGCDYDRIIVFDDDKILTCLQYGYQYKYRPRAIILYNGINFKMVVGDEIYDMSR